MGPPPATTTECFPITGIYCAVASSDVTRGASLKRTVTALAVGVSLIAAGCGTDSSANTTTNTTTTVESSVREPVAAIMAEAAHQLLTVDHTFAPGSNPFDTFLIIDHTEPAAGTRQLTDGERTSIERKLGSLGEVRWINDPEKFKTPDLAPTVNGSAIVGLGDPKVDGGTALIPVTLWCGGLCGTGLTYSLKRDAAGDWAIQGIDGPVVVS